MHSGLGSGLGRTRLSDRGEAVILHKSTDRASDSTRQLTTVCVTRRICCTVLQKPKAPSFQIVLLIQMSKTFIGGAVCREFESEAPAAEEMLD